MRMSLRFMMIAVVVGWVAIHSAKAEPLPGEILKFQQLPLNFGLPPSEGGAPFPGHDELSSAYALTGANSWHGDFMADDFADKFSTPVFHVRWWGSYIGTPPPPEFTSNKFLISFESDVPQSANNPFSHPGESLSAQIVRKGVLAPGSGTFTEKPIFSDGAPEQLFEYNAELNFGKEFRQEPNKVYWLKIVALLDSNNYRWGWHDRDYSKFDALASSPPAVVPGEFLAGTIPIAGGTLPVFHFQDDAVSGTIDLVTDGLSGVLGLNEGGYEPHRYLAPLDGPDVINQFSKDLAFELYTRPIPEPGMMGLIGVGVMTLSLRRRR